MLPENRASTTPVQGNLLAPDINRSSLLEDFELGGVAINDGTLGLEVQVWKLSIESSLVTLTPEFGAPHSLFSAAGVSEMSLAFDQNMRPVIGFVQNGLVRLYWYDPVASAFVFSDFPGARDPRLATDDKRRPNESASDVIFAYIQAGELRYRQQRDRYQVERVLKAGLETRTRLRGIGMTDRQRLQFELV